MKALLLVLILCASLAFAGSITTGQNTISTTAEKIVDTAGARLILRIKNDDASISIYIGADDDVTSSTGYLLKAGESIEIRSSAEVWAIAASGTPTVSFLSELQ